nr:MAG TPA: hypothetical protein [Caudoviricetes sp.]
MTPFYARFIHSIFATFSQLTHINRRFELNQW